MRGSPGVECTVKQVQFAAELAERVGGPQVILQDSPVRSVLCCLPRCKLAQLVALDCGQSLVRRVAAAAKHPLSVALNSWRRLAAADSPPGLGAAV